MNYKHRDNAQFSRAKWRKRLLIPCWIIQIGLLLGIVGLFSFRLSRTVYTWEEQENKGDVPMVEFVWEIINVVFSFVSLIIIFVSVAKYIAEVLTPLPLLFANIMNLVLASAVLALDIVVYTRFPDRKYSLTGIAMDCIIIAFTLIPTFYSVVIYRRLLEYDDYHSPYNAKPYGYASAEEPEEAAYRASWLEAPTMYDPTNPSATATRPRSLSAASRHLSMTLNNRSSLTPAAPSPEEAQSRSRHGSYDHKRDTQFDEYIRRRSSAGNYSKEDINKALGVEFGWEDSQDQRDSIISAGSVAVAQPRPRGDSLSSRQISCEASIIRSVSSSTTTTNTTATSISTSTSTPAMTLEAPAGMVRAHSLNSVPEAHEEEDPDHKAKAGRSRGASESQEVLLRGNGISRSSSGSSKRSSRRLEPVEGLEEVELGGQKKEKRTTMIPEKEVELFLN